MVCQPTRRLCRYLNLPHHRVFVDVVRAGRARLVGEIDKDIETNYLPTPASLRILKADSLQPLGKKNEKSRGNVDGIVRIWRMTREQPTAKDYAAQTILRLVEGYLEWRSVTIKQEVPIFF